MKKSFFIYLILLILAFSGCASTANGIKNLNKLSDAEIEAYNNNPDNTDMIVCKTESDIGSRIPKRVCRMKSVMDSRGQQDRQAVEGIQTRGKIITGNTGG